MKTEEITTPKQPGKLYGGLDTRRPFQKRVSNRKVKASTVKSK